LTGLCNEDRVKEIVLIELAEKQKSDQAVGGIAPDGSEIYNTCSEERVREIVRELGEKDKSEQASGGIHVDNTKENSSDKRDSSLLKEINDRKSRECNIILYRVPESESQESVARVSDDLELVKALFNILDLNDEEILDPKKPIRLGRKNEIVGNPRPVLIKVKSREDVDRIMRNARKLKNSVNPYKKIIIAHDMTKTERENAKALSIKAKEKSSGEDQYVVRGPPWNLRIVKKKKTKV